MLAKQLAIGQGPDGLIRYLFGEGRHNEHRNQRLVAGSDRLIAGFSGLNVAGDSTVQGLLAREFDGAWRQVRRENGLPLTPERDEQLRGAARADRIFHATISLGPKDRKLSDEEWAEVAREFVREMGFIDSDKGADCAWIAVNHGASSNGNDHIHIAVNLVREDGRRADVHRSKKRTAQAGARLAAKLGLEVVYDENRASGIGNVSRAELERAKREQREADRVTVRRRLAGASWNAHSEAEFVRAARATGLLVRPRWVAGGTDRVEGYSVALAGTGKPVWFAPSKLDKSLSLPTLREAKGWTFDQQMQALNVWRERAGAKQPGSDGLRLPTEDEIRKMRVTITETTTMVRWQRVASDSSAFLGAWALQAEAPHDRYLARASDALSKAAQTRAPRGRELAANAAHSGMLAAQAGSKNDTAARLAVLMEMMQLIDAIAQREEARRDLMSSRNELAEAMTPLHAEHKLLVAVGKREALDQLPEQARQVKLTAEGDPLQRVIRELELAERSSGPDPIERVNVRRRSAPPLRPTMTQTDERTPER